MARVLYTSVRGDVWAPGFIETNDLVSARQRLAEREHTRIAFWSHPALGDAPGETPEDAYRLAPKPPSLRAWTLAILLAVSALGALGTVVMVVLETFDAEGLVSPLVQGAIVVLFMGALLAGKSALPEMQVAIARRDYHAATALLWGMRVAIPFVAPLLELWAAQIRAARVGFARAMAPYRWMRHVGLRGAYDAIEDSVLNHCHDHAPRVEKLRARFDASPSSQTGVQLALVLAVDLGDHAAAREILARTSPHTGAPITRAAHQIATLFAAIEAGEAVSVTSVESARREWVDVSLGAGGTWMSLFDLAKARAAARDGQLQLAEESFARAARELLWSGEIELLDRGARDLVAARHP